MYSRSNRILGLAALAVGLGLTAQRASAQEAETFHLPFAAHWGPMVLESGDYRLSAPTGQSGGHLIFVSQPGHNKMVLAQSTEIQPRRFDRSSLELVNVNGAYFVRRYRLAVTGQVFTFAVPKATPETEMASAAVTSVPVAAAK
ncbi:MAG TPA: hypothetical protein VGK64_25015 [Bryobacteraceae bacterium]